MTLKASTGLRNKLLDTGSLRSIFNGGFLKIYKGNIPADADAIIYGSDLLVTISINSTGTGLTLASAASSGSITKTLADTWSGVAAAAGTATCWRLVTPTDTGASSTTEARLQGTAGTTGTDLVMATADVTVSLSVPIDSFTVTLPA